MAERRVALVTGGGGGIGGAICETLGRAGAAVLVAGRDPARCAASAEATRESGAEAEPLEMDVTDPASVEAALRRGQELLGPVDWLVNNAGAVRTLSMLKADEEHYRFHMEVNFHGARRVFAALLPGMLERGYGRAVQVASSAALRGYAYVSAYAAAKHALLGWSRSVALELAHTNVGLGVVCPHYVDSPMTDANVEAIVRATGRAEEDVRRFLESENPGGVLVTPEEVALAVLELLRSDRTGVVLELPGGSVDEIEPGLLLETTESRP